MKNRKVFFPILFAFVIFTSACNSMPTKYEMVESNNAQETLYVYEDGKMRLDSRFVDSQDVVIYSDGRGGERAAVKVHFPLHSDFYRDSIVVVRVENNFEESISMK
jgi:hypothetical protein